MRGWKTDTTMRKAFIEWFGEIDEGWDNNNV